MNEQQANDEYARRLFMVLYGPESWSPSNPKPEHLEINQEMVDRFRSYMEGPVIVNGQMASLAKKQPRLYLVT